MQWSGPATDRRDDAKRRSTSTVTLFRCDTVAAASDATNDSAALVAAVVSALDEAVIGLNAENRIIVWNHAAEALLGWPAAATIGRPVAVLGAEVSGHFDDLLPSLLRRVGVTSFVTCRRVDGPRGPIQTIALPDGKPQPPRGDSNDHPATGDPERQLQSILAAAADAIVTIDAKGVIQSFNPAAERMFGFTATEIVGSNVNLLIPPPHRGAHEAALARYCDTHVPHLIGSVRELVAQRKDGSRFPIALSVSEVDAGRRFTGIVHDLSEQKLLQEQLLTIAETEKRRIGQDLHDDVGQELTGLGLTAETLLEALEDYSVSEADLAARLVQGVRRTLQKLRWISRGLVTFEVNAEQFVPTLADLTTQLERADGIRCTFQCDSPVTLADSRVATQLYRIAQEATANAVRHARAQHITVILAIEDRALRMTIRDDGIGIGGSCDTTGTGLGIMRQRAGLIGADLSISDAPNGGTEVTCRLHDCFAAPLPASEGTGHER